MINSKQVLIFLCGLGVVAATISGEAFCSELRFKFQPGDKYFLSSDVEQQTTEIIDNNEVVTEQSTRLGNDLDIIEVNENGDALAQYTYRKAYLKLKKGNYNIVFDSDANQLRIPTDALPLGLVLGQYIFFKITTAGYIIDIKGIPGLISETKAAAPISQTRYQALAFIDKNFNETAIRRFNEERLAIYPSPNSLDKTSSDEVWTKVVDLNDDPPKRAEIWTFRLKERRNGTAFIDVNLIVQTAPDAEEIIAGGTKFKRIVTGGATGLFEIEEATGRIINESVTWDLNDQYKASAQGPVLRITQTPPPIKSHMVSKFQMIKRQDSPSSDSQPK